LGIFPAEERDAILMGGITLASERGYAAEQEASLILYVYFYVYET
jgi:hypothetical protein